MPAKRSDSYCYIFFAHNGPGPYPCHFCGQPVTFDDVHVHHVDKDHGNSDPSNLKAAHHSCHHRYHALNRTPDERKRRSESVRNSPRARAQRAKLHASRRGKKRTDLSPEARKRIGDAHRGPLSPERRAKVAEGMRRYHQLRREGLVE